MSPNELRGGPQRQDRIHRRGRSNRWATAHGRSDRWAKADFGVGTGNAPSGDGADDFGAPVDPARVRHENAWMAYEDELSEPLDRAEWEQREVYANFGLAVYFCQVLEFQLVTYLALIRKSKRGRPMSEADTDRLLERLLGGTFGRNMGEVRDLLGGRWILEAPMAEALPLRNNLVHHWMRERYLKQGTSANRIAMIDELREAQRILQEADRVITERTTRMFESAGIRWEVIQREYDRLTQLAESEVTDDPT